MPGASPAPPPDILRSNHLDRFAERIPLGDRADDIGSRHPGPARDRQKQRRQLQIRYPPGQRLGGLPEQGAAGRTREEEVAGPAVGVNLRSRAAKRSGMA